MSMIVRMLDAAVTMSVAVVVRLFVMETQQIYSVIVAVRRSDNRMHMEFLRLRISEEYTGVMIEFNEDHRALDAVVERVSFSGAAYPTEMCLLEMAFDLRNPGLERTGR